MKQLNRITAPLRLIYVTWNDFERNVTEESGTTASKVLGLLLNWYKKAAV